MSRSGRLYFDDVPDEYVAHVRAAAMALPDAIEEKAATGIRWRIRNNTFAQVLGVEGDEPVVALVFRSEGEDLDVLREVGHPFFSLPWGRGAVGMVLDNDTDWDDVGELVTDSYCVQAPKKLVALVERPS